MRLFNSIRRPFGGFMIDPGEQQAEAARAVEERFSRSIEHQLNIGFGRLTRRMERLMGNVQERLREVLESVKSQNTKIDSINTLMDGMRNEIQRLLENAGTDDTTKALVDQLFDAAKANSDKIDEAIAENPGGTPIPLIPISNSAEADAAAKAEAAAKAQAEAVAAQKAADDAAAAIKAKADADAAAAAEAAKPTETEPAPVNPFPGAQPTEELKAQG